MSTLAPPAPTAAVPEPPVPEARRRRTLVGFVGTRRIVEIILTVGDFVADPRIAAHHIASA